jgi:hypothetical protein
MTLVQDLPMLVLRPSTTERDILTLLFAKYAAPAVDFVLNGIDDQKHGKPLVQSQPRTAGNMIAQLCSILDGLLKLLKATDAKV